ncbi:putative aspartic-type endopeptidase opsB [Ceratocystis lukuohia]|uniref:Aspartic-type endopeptidase opsB n=1 Tax=Ceratocystis lukuohia TaxID=2019550 RepID=A0ABR4MJI5_9PEZI
MARYSLLFLSLAAAPLASAWPQLFDSPAASDIVAREGAAVPKIPYEVIKAREATPVVPGVAENAQPIKPDDEKHNLVRSAKFRGSALPTVADDPFTVTLPVDLGDDTLDTRDVGSVPEFKVTLVRSDNKIPRGLPVVNGDPNALYKITIPITAEQKRGLPVIDSDPDALFKIALPTKMGTSKRSALNHGVIELPAKFQVIEDRALPVVKDTADSFEVTLPVSIDARGLPVVSGDPDSLFKITLPLVKSPSSSKRENSVFSSSPDLHLRVPIADNNKVKRALPTGTTNGDSALSITLPVAISKRQHVATGKHSVTLRPPTEGENVPVKQYSNNKRQHVATDKHTVTLRPPTESENVPVKPYNAMQRRAEHNRKVRRTSSGVLKMPVIRGEKPSLTRRGSSEVDQALEKLQKRDDQNAISVAIANRSDVAYYAQLDFGTPPQPIYVQIDTGSFELWVNPSCNTLTAGDKVFCEAVGVYDPNTSSTSDGLKEGKNLRYGIGAANVTYFSDSIGMGDSATMTGVQFGVANSTEDQFAGILGMGYGAGKTTSYKNFVDELADQNITHSRTFSLGLGAKDNEEGVLIFGGVDTSKFSGPLTKLPIIPASKAPDGVPRYWVQMENITLTTPEGKVNSAYEGSNIPAFLDSGATLTLLPPKVADAIAVDFGVTDGVSSNGFYAVDCEMAKAKGSVDFAFNGVTIHVPYHEMVRTLATSPPSCWLGLVPSTDFTLLGDTFLRSVYAVFDADNHNIYLAPYENCGEQLVSLGDGVTPDDITGSCTLEAVITTSSALSQSAPTSSQTAAVTETPSDAEATTTSDAEHAQTTKPTAEPTDVQETDGLGGSTMTSDAEHKKTTDTPEPTESALSKKPVVASNTTPLEPSATSTSTSTSTTTAMATTDYIPAAEISSPPLATDAPNPAAAPSAPGVPAAEVPATAGDGVSGNSGPVDDAPGELVTASPVPGAAFPTSRTSSTGAVQTAGAQRTLVEFQWNAVGTAALVGVMSAFGLW